MTEAGAGAMRILYVGTLGPTDTSTHRKWALEQLGMTVAEFDTRPYVTHGGPLLSNLRGRTLIGLAVRRLNRDLLAQARRWRPDVVWFDKASYLWPRTAAALRAEGIYTVHFNIDNPFGPRNDPGGRLLRAAVPYHDLHLVQRDVSLADYRAAGAPDVRLMRTAYEPTRHFPPPEGWSDADRVNDVVYIGAPYDGRAEFLLELWRRYGIPTRIWGSPKWASVLPPDAKAALWQGGELWNEAYREGIWRSRICLAWVTHSNRDDVAHKAFEIAACGGFLLAEDTPGHRAHFAADEEAVFFRSVEECAALIRRYGPDEAARTRIGQAARRRAERSGYSNDARIADALGYIAARLGARRERQCAAAEGSRQG